MKLLELRSELCTGVDSHCRRCFLGKPTANLQCPPNVFRTNENDELKPIAFIFDKPNDNTRYKTSPIVPIVAFDDRAGIDIRLARSPSHANLLHLCRLLGFISNDSQDLSSPITHITNAVKCDVSCETGQTGRIAVSSSQAETCIANFLIRELDAVNSKALVFFGKNAQKYVLNEDIPLWTISNKVVGNRMYKVMRVPHTSPESFNTYGEKGEAYVQPFKELLAAINIGG